MAHKNERKQSKISFDSVNLSEWRQTVASAKNVDAEIKEFNQVVHGEIDLFLKQHSDKQPKLTEGQLVLEMIEYFIVLTMKIKNLKKLEDRVKGRGSRVGRLFRRGRKIMPMNNAIDNKDDSALMSRSAEVALARCQKTIIKDKFI